MHDYLAKNMLEKSKSYNRQDYSTKEWKKEFHYNTDFAPTTIPEIEEYVNKFAEVHSLIKENVSFYFGTDTDYDGYHYVIWSLSGSRPENDKEKYERENKKEVEAKKKAKAAEKVKADAAEKRRKQYEKLKKEFENG